MGVQRQELSKSFIYQHCKIQQSMEHGGMILKQAKVSKIKNKIKISK
jgi:hypothetical protein